VRRPVAGPPLDERLGLAAGGPIEQEVVPGIYQAVAVGPFEPLGDEPLGLGERPEGLGVSAALRLIHREIDAGRRLREGVSAAGGLQAHPEEFDGSRVLVVSHVG
jgi:hypothetical protein